MSANPMHLFGSRMPSAAAADVAMARQLMAAGQWQQAEACVRRAVTAEPDNGAALELLAAFALNAGFVDAAVELAQRALAGRGAGQDAERVLGMALHRRGDLLPAAVALRRAVAHQQDLAGLRMELGHVERGLGRAPAALAQYLAAYKLDPLNAQAQWHFVDALGSAFSLGLRLPEGQPAVLQPARAAKVSVVMCSIDDAKFERAQQTYRRLLQGLPHEIIRIPDAKSLCEGYNRGIAQASGDVLVFSHDDIEILNDDFAARLLTHLDQFDVVGVVGTRRMAGLTWLESGWPHAQGRVVHFDRPQGRYELSVYRVDQAVVGDIQALDGLFFAVRRESLDKVRFDAEVFDGFHAYDLDFSFSAHLAGLRIAVCNDIVVAHDSRGNFNDSYRSYADRFARKHAARLQGVPTAPPGPVATVGFANRADALAFAQLHLALLCAPDPQALLAAAMSAMPPVDHPLTVWWTHLDSTSVQTTAYHDSGNHSLLNLLGKPPRCCLEIGCGAGGLGLRLKQMHPQARAYGVELNQAAAALAATRLDGAWQGRVEDFAAEHLGLQAGDVDLLVLGDVLEHLYDPWRAMLKLRGLLAADAEVLISIPNVRNLALLAEAAEGDWSYQPAGLLDITHIRFFTLKEFRRLLSQTGFEVRDVECVIDGRLAGLYAQHEAQAGGIKVNVGRMSLERLSAAEFRELCSIQFRLKAVLHAA